MTCKPCRCVASVFFEHPAAAGRTYAYRMFIIVGDLATVRASVRRLHGQQTAR